MCLTTFISLGLQHNFKVHEAQLRINYCNRALIGSVYGRARLCDNLTSASTYISTIYTL
uniref:Uncharacterized protein n=1 Tax=Anguilla anguilla TaxID=7936 RepID=A0A0E9WMM6_ANGAN